MQTRPSVLVPRGCLPADMELCPVPRAGCGVCACATVVLQPGLGRFPAYMPSVSNLLLFNSEQNPYKQVRQPLVVTRCTCLRVRLEVLTSCHPPPPPRWRWCWWRQYSTLVDTEKGNGREDKGSNEPGLAAAPTTLTEGDHRVRAARRPR